MKKLEIARIVVLILGVVAVVIAMCVRIPYEMREYNDGVCPACGGMYHLVGTPTKVANYFTYECEDCGHTVLTHLCLSGK